MYICFLCYLLRNFEFIMLDVHTMFHFRMAGDNASFNFIIYATIHESYIEPINHPENSCDL